MGGNNTSIAMVANPSRPTTARAIDAATATPPRNGVDRTRLRRQGNDERAGGRQGAAHAATRRPSVNAWAINKASATPTQRQQGTNAIAAPGGGMRRNAEAIC